MTVREAREARRRADEALAHEITVIHLASRRNYGVPRVTAELRRQDRLVNRKRVARVMREHAIVGNSRRTGRRSLTKADTEAAPSPDLIGRDFTATRPGTKTVGDITYIPTAEGWLCLASWLDLATREVIGYSMADHHRAELVVDALDLAAALGRLEPGCVVHSDTRIGIHLPSTARQNRHVGEQAKHGPDRELLRQRRRGELLGRTQRGDRHPLLARPPAPASSTSSRPSTTDAACASTSTGATSHPTRHACATSRIRPSRRNDDVSKIMGNFTHCLNLQVRRLLDRLRDRDHST
ncbi:IS3 family transposase [Streptomyces sp. NPDC079020]|uniref:IS3 family transposase n=1 Tax=Streptomyces sp. NPDC079020 TaxID=3365722 RepID=UPI0037CCEBF5